MFQLFVSLCHCNQRDGKYRLQRRYALIFVCRPARYSRLHPDCPNNPEMKEAVRHEREIAVVAECILARELESGAASDNDFLLHLDEPTTQVKSRSISSCVLARACAPGMQAAFPP